MDVMEMSEMNESDMIQVIMNAKKSKKIYEPVNHSKTLIIISGNLDEVFSMASQTSEADIDADIFNAFTQKLTVFPVQGVRPIFSSIIDILEANMSNFVFEAIMTDEKKVSIDYDPKKQQIVAAIGKKKLEIPYVGRIDKIRQANEEDTVANISVHECGHAVVYMGLMGMAPLQLKSKIASSYAGGFTFPHQIHETRDNIVNKIKIYLAGGIAEEIIFGKQDASRSEERRVGKEC